MRNVSGLALASALLLAACSDQVVDIGQHNQDIIGGQNVNVGEYPTVVAVLNRGLCTGTLIAPNIVLTAAHCVHPGVLGGTQAQITQETQVVLDTVNVFSGAGRSIQAIATIPHPGFSAQNPGAGNDVAIIRLESSVSDRNWTPINRARVEAPVGMKLLQVGFGATDGFNQQSTAGRLHSLANKTTIPCSSFGSSDDMHICYSQTDGSGKCVGDSGGPSFLTINGQQRVVGVTSVGDPECQQGGLDMRVDSFVAWLEEVAPELVDGEPPPGGELGEECDGNTDCDSGLCVTGPGGEMLCSQICDPENDNCPNGFDCLPAGNGQGACWPEEGGSDNSDENDNNDGNNADGNDGNDDGGCGCRTGGQSSGAPLAGGLLLLGLVGLVIRRRR